MTKHTPGPWVEEATGLQPGAYSVIGDGRQMVALVYGENRDAQKANADLIAAAPKMYELLKLALGDTEYILSQGFWNEVRTVVAQAEGAP